MLTRHLPVQISNLASTIKFHCILLVVVSFLSWPSAQAKYELTGIDASRQNKKGKMDITWIDRMSLIHQKHDWGASKGIRLSEGIHNPATLVGSVKLSHYIRFR